MKEQLGITEHRQDRPLSPSQQFPKYKVSSSDPCSHLHIHTPMDMFNRHTTLTAVAAALLCSAKSYAVCCEDEVLQSARLHLHPNPQQTPSYCTCLPP